MSGSAGVTIPIMETPEHDHPSSLRGHSLRARSLPSALVSSSYGKRLHKSVRTFHHHIKRSIDKKLPFKSRQLSDTSGSDSSMEDSADRAFSFNMPSPAVSPLSSLAESKEEEEGERVMTEDEREMSKMGLTQLLDHVLKLRGNERVMAGQDGAAMLRALVAAGLEQGDQEAIEVDRRMREDTEVAASLAYVEVRGQACKDLLYTRVDAPDSGWTLCSESKGTKTYCQDAEDGRCIRVRVEGELPVSPMEMLAVIREFDLYKCWMPLCSESRVIFRRGCEQTFYIRLSAGLLGWDLLGNGTGCDCMVEDGSVVLLADSIEDGDPRAPDAPRQQDSLTFWRVAVHDAKFRFKVRDESSVSCTATFVLDPRMTGFSDIFNWVVKKIAGRLLSLLTYHGSKVLKEGHKSYLTQAMVANSDFYRDFLAPRHWWICKSMGKTQAPKVYDLLSLTVQDAEAIDPYPGRQFSPSTSSSRGPPPALPVRSTLSSISSRQSLAGQEGGERATCPFASMMTPTHTTTIKATATGRSSAAAGLLGYTAAALLGALLGAWVMYVFMPQGCGV